VCSSDLHVLTSVASDVISDAAPKGQSQSLGLYRYNMSDLLCLLG